MKYNESIRTERKSGSRPARGAWVEMLMATLKPLIRLVAPRKGRVG